MSDNLIPISDEQAKLGQEIVKAFHGLGAFLAQALGSTPEDLIGYLGGDWLRFRRAENIARLLSEARERLAARGIEQPKPASLSVALPILRSGADEDREVLVDLWARLLANAMDPSLSNVRQQFISAVQGMDPPDAAVLNFLREGGFTEVALGSAPSGETRLGTAEAARDMSVTVENIQASVEHLAALGILTKPDIGRHAWFFSAMGKEFIRACYPERAKRS